MNKRATRKQILIAECERNRLRVVEDSALLTSNMRKMGSRVGKFKTIASSVALLVTAFAAFQKGARKQNPKTGKPTWPQTLLKGAGFVSTVWLAIQAPRRDP